jgi:LacI family transcriptional regulator
VSNDAAQRLTGGDRPTIYDVARRAAVSPATVSNVLRGVTTVSAENMRRVFEAIGELGYRRDPLAANLRRNRRALIGLIVPDFKNPFFGSLIAAIEKLAEKKGYRLVAVSSHDDDAAETQQIDALIDWRVAGIVIVPSGDSTAGVAALKADSMPTVMLDRVGPGGAFDSVGVENAQACAAMVRRFYDAGHRRLLVAVSTLALSNMRARLEGIHAAATAMPEPMRIEILRSGLDIESAKRAMAERFDKGPAPTAIFALFIQATLAALREIARRGLSLPDDISLAGFDDFEWMQVMHPPVAAVVQPVEALAARAFSRLVERIEQPGRPPVFDELACDLAFRGSIAPPPQSARPTDKKSKPASSALAGLKAKKRKKRAV